MKVKSGQQELAQGTGDKKNDLKIPIKELQAI